MSDEKGFTPQHWDSEDSTAGNISQDLGGIATTLDGMGMSDSAAGKGFGNLSILSGAVDMLDHSYKGEYAELTIDGFGIAGGWVGGIAGGIALGGTGALASPAGIPVGAAAGAVIGSEAGQKVGEDIGHGVVALGNGAYTIGSWAIDGVTDYFGPDVDSKTDRLDGLSGDRITSAEIQDRIDNAFGVTAGFDSGRWGDTGGWDGGSGYDTGFNSDGWGGDAGGSSWSDGGGNETGGGWDGGSGYDTGFNSDGWSGDSSSSSSDWSGGGSGNSSGSSSDVSDWSGGGGNDYSGSGWDGGSGYDTGFNSDGWL